MWSVIGIILGLVLLVIFAFKGCSLIWSAPLCAFVVSLFSGMNLLTSYTETYMSGFVNFVLSWFPAFLLSSLFGRVMEVTGCASAITEFLARRLGSNNAILVIVICTGILTYGGISGFVIIFSVYPIALGLFRKADIPRRLLPATIAGGSFSFAMTALPGTIQIQNLIPMKYFGTPATAAPVIGCVSGVIMFVGVVLWLNYRKRKLTAAGEHFEEPDNGEQEIPAEKLPNIILSILPFVVVVAMLNVFKLDIVICLLAGVVLCIALNIMRLSGRLRDTLNEGCRGATTAMLNTAAAVGFGTVVGATTGFVVITEAILSIKASPLISAAIAINILAGATGSASGGLSIAMEAMSDTFIQMSVSSGISLQTFHRICSLSCGGLNTVPHDGAVVTFLNHCGISHKKGYFDIFMVNAAIPIAALIVAIILGSLGIV